MINSHSEFMPPPEAPVFEPTSEEFEDPMSYISKIRPIAEKAGICKIRPPPGWQPPFAVDVDNFRFTPRVQRLNELEAKTRIKLNFLDQLAKFWELQGVPLKIPMVDKKCTDLYSLHKAVQDDGGFSIVSKNAKWPKISFRLGYADSFGSVFQQNYEKILFPYDIFLAKMESSQENSGLTKETCHQRKCKTEAEDSLGGQCSSKSEMGMKAEEAAEKKRLDYNLNSELRKLQFFGAGPKTALPDASVVCTDEKASAPLQGSKFTRTKTRDKRIMASLESAVCSTCGTGGNFENMLICDGCDEVCHVYCLILPLTDNQKNEWRCTKCIAKECQKPLEVYGFEQARREYTLQTFGQMADKFKIDYFNLPTHVVPCSAVEMEFWRLVNCIEEDVVVEYGADIHSSECGSGFPTEKTRHIFPDDDKYIRSGWNLNNIPNLSSSVLHFINVDISGMKVPWCYVGMCFSSFAWHIEDHWSSSINYLHWGEPKTWYGVPGAKAELLEECMKSNASELFEQSPDLLHQLTTIMNPNTLMQCGVPIVRTDQHAGEFVITFPRSYHAGFNQGYNFAEAVNFCAPEWLEMGRLCIEHYRLLKRQCVFSHEELICKMADGKESLMQTMAVMVHQNLLAMIEEEKNLRKQVHDQGIIEAEHEAFELLPDDERQCEFCKTTCFLSAITCFCSGSKLVCVRHFDKLCKCPMSQLCLRYRYTLDELLVMLHRLRVQLEDFDNWAFRAKTILDAKNEKRQDISKFKALLKEAEENRFPFCPLRDSLVETCAEADKCAAVASHLVSKKVCTRQRETGESQYAVKLSQKQLEEFLDEIETLPCRIKEEAIVQDLVKKVHSLEADIRSAINTESPDLEQLERLMDEGIMLDIDLPDLALLKKTINRIKWLQEVTGALSAELRWDTICRLIDAGVSQAPHPLVEKAISQLQDVLTSCESFDKKAKDCLSAKPKYSLFAVETVIEESSKCPVKLPSVTELCDAVKAYKEWIAKFQALDIPNLSVAENLMAKGHQIPILMNELNQLESQVKTSQEWRDQAAGIFLKKKSLFTLLEVLSPRADIACSPSNRSKRRRVGSGDCRDLAASNVVIEKETLERDPELSAMLELRAVNRLKANPEDLYSLHCVCRQKKHGTMFQCQLCNELYHVKCMSSARHAVQKDTQSASLNFLCPSCVRSRRPSLSSLSSLLVAMAELPLQLPEADALKMLLERTILWQDEVQDLLSHFDLKSLLVDESKKITEMTENTGSCDLGRTSSASSFKQSPQSPHSNGSGDSKFIPSSDLLQCLEELMVRGDLLEVSLEEKEIARSVLRKFHVNYQGLLIVSPDMPDEEDPAAKRVEKRVMREQRKRPVERDTRSEVQSSRPKRIRKVKQQSKVDEFDAAPGFQAVEANDDEDDEECSADVCLKPTSEELEWVQCDTCEKWFHFLCIGLQKGDVSEHEEFECKACSIGRSSSQSNCRFSPVIENVISIASQGMDSQSAFHKFPSRTFFPAPSDDPRPDEIVDISDCESEDLDYSGNDLKKERSLDCDVIIVE